MRKRSRLRSRETRALFRNKMMLLTPELVALTLRDVLDDGPEPGWTALSEAELDCLVDRIEREVGGDRFGCSLTVPLSGILSSSR
jgi:hypothetical protein